MVRIPDDTYRAIKKVVPIACVDLLVVNGSGEVLLIRRTNEPARGYWWLPGGRVDFGETRHEAALRKLRTECGLVCVETEELRTFDVILDLPQDQGQSHGITTVFRIDAGDQRAVVLDAQSDAAVWRSKAAWLDLDLHPFVRTCLGLL